MQEMEKDPWTLLEDDAGSGPSYANTATIASSDNADLKASCWVMGSVRIIDCFCKVLFCWEEVNAVLDPSVDFLSPYDADGHGSHVASIAAGNHLQHLHEVIVEDGKLMYKKTDILVETTEDSKLRQRSKKNKKIKKIIIKKETEDCKWIFVLSTSRNLYAGQNNKGKFQHSSFLAGSATTAAGRLVAQSGVFEAIWPYSGHYHSTEENFLEFISFLEEHNDDLTNVKRCAIDDDDSSAMSSAESMGRTNTFAKVVANVQEEIVANKPRRDDLIFGISRRLLCKWSTGAGPRIGCFRDYPHL